MTKHNEQLPRSAAELEQLASYYNSHDTSTEMEHGEWVEPSYKWPSRTWTKHRRASPGIAQDLSSSAP